MGLRSSVGRRATSAGRCGGLPGAAPGRVPQPLLHRVADLRDGVHVVRETADVDYERVMPTPHHDRLAAGDRPAGARKRLVVPALPPRDDALPGVVNGARLRAVDLDHRRERDRRRGSLDSSMNGCTTDLAKKLEPRRRPCLRPCRSTGRRARYRPGRAPELRAGFRARRQRAFGGGCGVQSVARRPG